MAKVAEKTCPDCGVYARGKRSVQKIFKFRTMKTVLKSGEVKEVQRPQSRCQLCRSAWNAARYGKTNPRPKCSIAVLIAKYKKKTGDTKKRSADYMWKALGY